jgi:ribosome-binding protein aMBF1 (putative translation factor)
LAAGPTRVTTQAKKGNDDMPPIPPGRSAGATTAEAQNFDRDRDRDRDAVAPISVRISTAIRITGIGRSKLYELIGSGQVDVVKIGSSTLIPVASLHRLLERNRR